MKKIFGTVLIVLIVILVKSQEFRAPAYPLITHDPYFSIWSTTDLLTASSTKHWTGANHSLIGMVKVDGIIYRFMGTEEKPYKTIVPAADELNYEAAYTESTPTDDWKNLSFNDSQWKKGQAPFGDNASVDKTSWKTKDLWVRRSFNMVNAGEQKLFLKLQHDDNVEVYLNGALVYETKGWTGKYIYLPLSGEIKHTIKTGKNVLAIHVANTAGGAKLDVGMVAEQAPTKDVIVKIADQTSVTMNATQTIYTFTCGKTDLTLSFTSPLLTSDLNLLSRPVTYINAKLKSNDGAAHEVEVYLGASTDIATNTPSQEVKTEKYAANGLSILKAGTSAQPVLQKKGDDLRIDWGYMYLAVPTGAGVQQSVSAVRNPSQLFSPVVAPISIGKHLYLNSMVNLGKVGAYGK